MGDIATIFLSYANYSLTDDPMNIYKIFEEIRKCLVIKNEMHAEELTHAIDHFAKMLSSDCLIRELVQKTNWGGYSDNYSSIFINDATKCWLGYKYCWIKIAPERILGPDALSAFSNRRMCHECYQLFFNNILEQIVYGVEYSDMGILFDYLHDEPPIFEDVLIINRPKGSKFEKTIVQEVIYDIIPLMVGIDNDNLYEAFIHLLHRTVHYSLIQFLLKNDRKKLKKCDQCENYYIAKTSHPMRFCTNKCRSLWHNRERIASGKASEYKRKKRQQGAKPSYYG